jgi:hypothetical protein
MKLLWNTASLFLVLACSWFAIMELILRHPGFAMRAIFALLIVQYALLCLRYAHSNAAWLRPVLAVFVVLTLTVGIGVLCIDLRSSHFEGYILLIAVGLITHAVLTLVNLLHPPRLSPA